MFCAYTWPRYQVCVYRTIGPLVCSKQVVFVFHFMSAYLILFCVLLLIYKFYSIYV